MNQGTLNIFKQLGARTKVRLMFLKAKQMQQRKMLRF